MKIPDLRKFPTEINYLDVASHLSVFDRENLTVPFGTWAADMPKGWHESLLRSYQVLQKVKHLLSIGTPAEVILEIIEESGE